MLLLITSAAALEPSWDCDSTASYPTLESMRSWYDALMDDPALGLADVFESWRDAQVDESCVPVDCSVSQASLDNTYSLLTHACEQYACVTAAGAAIAWSRETWDDPGFWGDSTSDTTERWAVSLSDGTTVRASHTISEASWYFDDVYSEWDALTITWEGSPIAGLPADSSFTAAASYSQDWYFYTESHGGSWTTDGCTVYASEATTAEDEDQTVSTATRDGQVWRDTMLCVNSPIGYLDGVRLGVVHPTTWALSGADGDADGVEAPADCDDADATVSPCAEEVAADGIDQDCDGVDG